MCNPGARKKPYCATNCAGQVQKAYKVYKYQLELGGCYYHRLFYIHIKFDFESTYFVFSIFSNIEVWHSRGQVVKRVCMKVVSEEKYRAQKDVFFLMFYTLGDVLTLGGYFK